MSLKSLFRWLLAGATVCVALSTALLFAFLAWERSKQDELDARLEPLLTRPPPTQVEVRDANGETFDRFGVQRRIRVDLADISPFVVEAVVAAEDRRFWEHDGIDVFGIARAALTNYRAGTVVEGGSTLTQQLVKSTLLSPERNLARKVDEALLARRLEARVSKRALLERYLNTVYLGSGNYGVEAAARDYYDVSASELDRAQAAMLAALIPAPSAYSPFEHPERARKERSRVLGDLVEIGSITQEEREELEQRPLLPRRDGTTRRSATGEAYRTAIRRNLRKMFGEEAPSTIGLVVDTPYDPALQRQVEHAMRRGIDAVYDRRGRIEVARRLVSTAEYRTFVEEAPGLRRSADGHPMVPEVGDCFEVMVREGWREVQAGPYRVKLPTRAWQSQVRDPDEWRSVASLPWGSVLNVCMDEEGVDLVESDWLTGAAVVLDNETGGVMALASGRNMVLEGFNEATQGRRQPGSTFKPYVYGAALEKGRTQLDIELDAPVRIGRWTPSNAGSYSGPITLRTALTYSRNTVAARIISQVGARPVQQLAHAAGIRSPLRDDLTIALGSSEVTLLEHAAAYGTFARHGVAIEPVFIRQLADAEGNSVARPGDVVQVADRQVRLPGQRERAMRPDTAAQVVDMLQSVVRRGTGRRAFREDRARAGKTGTTSDYVEGWFVGMTPRYTIGVWIGSRDHETMGDREYGGRTALPVWAAIADHLDDPSERFPVPAEAYLEEHRGELVVLPRRDPAPDGGDTLPPFPDGTVATR